MNKQKQSETNADAMYGGKATVDMAIPDDVSAVAAGQIDLSFLGSFLGCQTTPPALGLHPCSAMRLAQLAENSQPPTNNAGVTDQLQKRRTCAALPLSKPSKS